MIKSDLARIVYETHGGISYREAAEIVDLVVEAIKESLVRQEDVKLTGFGTFNLVPRKSRMGRNPQTGERIKLDPSNHVTFRISRLNRF